MIKNYLYQITNLINNKIYVGVHKTKNIDDGYMGSGKIIKSAIQKYGIENFRKDILEMFDTYQMALDKEAEIVTEEFLQCEDVYNLRKGGFGGFDYINKLGRQGYSLNPVLAKENYNYIRPDNLSKEILSSRAVNGGKSSGKLHKENRTGIFDPSVMLDSINRLNSNTAIAKKKKTFVKIQHQQGHNNSQFGTRWIRKDNINKKIPVADFDVYITDGWLPGRK